MSDTDFRAASRKGVDAVADEIARATPDGDGVTFHTTFDGPTVSAVYEIDRHGETLRRVRITVTVEELGLDGGSVTAPPPLRMTRNTREALRTLNEHPGLCGIDITRKTGITAGTLYPLLDRLETHGLATSEWEDPEDTDPGTPRRRFYTLTAAGRAKAKEIGR